MMSIEDVKAENQRNYLKLIVALEASQGILNLLIAVCDDSNLRESIIQQYEAELQQQNFLSYRIRVRWQDPSLRYALAQLVKNQPFLQQGQPAVITVLGIDGLLSAKLDAQKSEQDRFFGYLQWTREALREFTFPIVLWVSESILVSLAQRAPDFWSWRGGVFWFTRDTTAETTNNYVFNSGNVPNNPVNNSSQETTSLPLEEILRLIEQIEAQGKEAPLLATLYNSLANAYQQRSNSHQNRLMAIQAYEKAISLEKKLNLKADLAESLFRLGKLYFEQKDNVKQADNYFQEALEIFRFVGDKQGEANTLKAVGDLLQFLDRREEALNSYETALSFYREIGDKLGEANVLQEFGKLAQTAQALEYLQQAQLLYIECGDIESQSRNLLFIAEALLDMGNKEGAYASLTNALHLATSINNTQLQKYAQKQIRFLQEQDGE